MKSSPTSTLTPDKKSKPDDQVVILIGNLTDDIPPGRFVVSKKDTMQTLFDQYCDDLVSIYNLGLTETEEVKNSKQIFRTERNYFGLRYSDHEGRLHWLENEKSVYKQLSESRARSSADVSPAQYKITFRMKHYPEKLTELASTLSHYLFFLQIRRDLIQGRLLCPKPEDIVKVGSLIYQAEEGDATFANIREANTMLEQSDDSPLNKKIFLRPNEGPDMKILLAYQELRGKMTKTQAVHALLDQVTNFPTYGIDPYQVEPLFQVPLKDSVTNLSKCDQEFLGNNSVEAATTKAIKRSETMPAPSLKKNKKMSPSTSLILPKDAKSKPSYYLGISHRGLQLFVGTQPTMDWTWDQISQMKYSKNIFKILTKAQKKDMKHAFQLQSESAALSLWKWANDRKFFFTFDGDRLSQGKKAKIVKSSNSFLKRGKSFKFSGSCQADVKQVVQAMPKSNQKEIMYTSMRIVNMNGTNLQKLEALGLSRTAKASVTSRPGLVMEPASTSSDAQSAPKNDCMDSLERENEPAATVAVDCDDKLLNGSGEHDNLVQRQPSTSSQKSTIKPEGDSQQTKNEEELVTMQMVAPVNASPTEANGALSNGNATSVHMKSNGHVVPKPADKISIAPVVIGAVVILVLAITVFVLESRKKPDAAANRLNKMAYQMRHWSVVDQFGKVVYDPIRDAVAARFTQLKDVGKK